MDIVNFLVIALILAFAIRHCYYAITKPEKIIQEMSDWTIYAAKHTFKYDIEEAKEKLEAQKRKYDLIFIRIGGIMLASMLLFGLFMAFVIIFLQ